MEGCLIQEFDSSLEELSRTMVVLAHIVEALNHIMLVLIRIAEALGHKGHKELPFVVIPFVVVPFMALAVPFVALALAVQFMASLAVPNIVAHLYIMAFKVIHFRADHTKEELDHIILKQTNHVKRL